MKLAKRSATGLLAFRPEVIAIGETAAGLPAGDRAICNFTFQTRANGSTAQDGNKEYCDARCCA